jgi:hypothetical protein
VLDGISSRCPQNVLARQLDSTSCIDLGLIEINCYNCLQHRTSSLRDMDQVAILFVSTFSTLLAIINPLEALPVFLRLLEGKDRRAHRQVVLRACIYATLLAFFFLIFGTLRLQIFEVPHGRCGSSAASS